jgi:hypothetical protein
MLVSAAHGADSESTTIKFSNPDQPGTLKLTVATGDLDIRGSDTAEVTVRTELKPEGQAQRKDGLRVLTTSSTYSLVEKDNVITLSYGADSWPGAGGDFDITVPRNTNVIISSSFGGHIHVGEISGDLEIKSLNGEVTLDQVAGGALVETMNGEIKADIVALKENTPLSFSSMNGEVALRLPSDAKANVRLRTHNGSILTDFDETQLVTKTASLKGVSGPEGSHAMGNSVSAEVRIAVREAVKLGQEMAREAAAGAREALREANGQGADDDEHHRMPVPPMAPLPPMTGGKIVTGTLNGGGPEIRISTMNGDVTVRKSAPRK